MFPSLTLNEIKFLSNETVDAAVVVSAIQREEQVLTLARALNISPENYQMMKSYIESLRSGMKEDHDMFNDFNLDRQLGQVYGAPVGNPSDEALNAMGISSGHIADQEIE